MYQKIKIKTRRNAKAQVSKNVFCIDEMDSTMHQWFNDDQMEKEKNEMIKTIKKYKRILLLGAMGISIISPLAVIVACSEKTSLQKELDYWREKRHSATSLKEITIAEERIDQITLEIIENQVDNPDFFRWALDEHPWSFRSWQDEKRSYPNVEKWKKLLDHKPKEGEKEPTLSELYNNYVKQGGS